MASISVPAHGSNSRQLDPVAVDILAGTFGGICQTIIGHPFDTVKVRMQTASGGSSSLVQSVRDIMRAEGPTGFFRGIESPLVGTMAMAATKFFTYNGARRAIVDYEVGQGNPVPEGLHIDFTMAGAVTGAAMACVEAPVDRLKTLRQTAGNAAAAEAPAAAAHAGLRPPMAVGPVSLPAMPVHGAMPRLPTMAPPALLAWQPVAGPSYAPSALAARSGAAAAPTTLQVARQIMRVEGVAGIFHGLTATMLRNIPACMSYFTTYEAMKLVLRRDFAVEGGMNALLAGGIGGLAFWGTTYPVDVIKSTIQGDAILPAQRRFTGVVSAVRHLYADGGVARFYRGVTPCLMRAALAHAACFAGFEHAKATLTSGNDAALATER